MLCAALTAGVSVQQVWCHPKSYDWWENVVLATFDNGQWLANFRMCRATFDMLTNRLQPRLPRLDMRPGLAIPVDKRDCSCLVVVATGSGYHTVAHLFGIGKATSSVCSITLHLRT